jgi:type IV pilus assembly protein PilA
VEHCCVSIRRAHGFALIDLIFVCGIIGLLAAIAMPKMLLAKQAAGSASAIGSLRAINSAQLTYALACGNGFYAPDLTTLGTTPPGSNEAFISPDLGTANSVQKSGYTIQMTGTAYPGAPATCNGLDAGAAAQGFKAGADPTDPGNVRFLATNSNQVIYESTTTLYDDMPELGEPDVGEPLR